MSVPHPTEIRWLEQREVLSIQFSDDTQKEFPAAFLRGFCPCARCQGHGAGPPKFKVASTPAATRVEDVTPVGNYALCIVWGDGHDTGIFSFASLYAMNPDAFDPDTPEGTPLETAG